MANKPANSLQSLLHRKRPQKARTDPGWTIDDLTNAGGMHGIKEFVEQALSVDPVRLALSTGDHAGIPKVGIPKVGIPNQGVPNNNSDIPSLVMVPSAQTAHMIPEEETHVTEPQTIGIPSFGIPELLPEAPIKGIAPPIPFPGLTPTPGETPQPLRPMQPELAEIGLSSVGAGSFGIPELDFGEPLEFRSPRDYPIREARLAQDGHTRGEQAIYAALWRLSDEGKRTISIGLTTLARRAGMSRSTCQLNLATLESKLSVEIHEPRSKGGSRSYRVHSYEEILRRRRAAGLTHFQRVTSGVRLLTAEGRELNIGIPRSGIAEHNSGIPSSGMPTASFGIPNFGTQKIDKELQEKTTTTITESEIAEVVAALRRMTGRSDDNAARTMLMKGREVTPDLNAHEVADMIEQEAPALFRNPRLDNPMGALITRIPACCQGETLRLFRAEQQQREIAKARDIAQNWSHHTQAEQEWATVVLTKDQNT